MEFQNYVFFVWMHCDLNCKVQMRNEIFKPEAGMKMHFVKKGDFRFVLRSNLKCRKETDKLDYTFS